MTSLENAGQFARKKLYAKNHLLDEFENGQADLLLIRKNDGINMSAKYCHFHILAFLLTKRKKHPERPFTRNAVLNFLKEREDWLGRFLKGKKLPDKTAINHYLNQFVAIGLLVREKRKGNVYYTINPEVLEKGGLKWFFGIGNVHGGRFKTGGVLKRMPIQNLRKQSLVVPNKPFLELVEQFRGGTYA